ncbi:MAG: hypothetical protein IEMM0008_1594 [bacterium]|nr:MAG: hypothetical protein IEMM0008_1594 [bacterium]
MSAKSYNIQLDNHIVPYSVRISHRAKRLRLVITREKGLEVVTPKKISQSKVRGLLNDHSVWILSKINVIHEIVEYKKLKPIVEGYKLLFLGKTWTLQCDKSLGLKRVSMDDAGIYINFTYLNQLDGPQDSIRNLLTNWYRNQAKEVIYERVMHYSRKMGVQFNRISIKSQKTRWGSCSSLKNLNFNWRLIMAPLEVLDYIIIHELAHLKELNHSPEFWKLVQSVCPDYRNHELWLNRHGQRLTF